MSVYGGFIKSKTDCHICAKYTPMNFRYVLFVCLFNITLYNGLFAQNLFPEKVDVRYAPQFCMDCGMPKATADSFVLGDICNKINYRYSFKGGGSGTISFQVLVYSTGFSCVLSHNDPLHSQLTNDLIVALNTCIWHPAMENGKAVNSSVNVMFTIANGKISANMQRLDLAEMRPPGNPTVYNKQYKYSNPSLSSYNFTVYTKYNSPLPDNAGKACIVDMADTLWYASPRGLTRFNGSKFLAVNETNSPFTAITNVSNIAVDREGSKWMYADRTLFLKSNKGWQVFDSAHLNIPKPYRIVTTPTGEVFFPNSKGLLILHEGKIRLIDNNVVWQLPSNNVYYAYYDMKGRLWIGTAKGTIMLDKQQKVTVFNSTHTPLANTCITNITEDGQGNMYFTMNSCRKSTGDLDEEGIAIMTADGQWSHYNDKNSGLPANHVNHILYDKVEHVLWIATQKAGLARFDLKDGWEVYNNANSAAPGFEVYQLAQDSKGTVYASTANGLLMMVKKPEAAPLRY